MQHRPGVDDGAIEFADGEVELGGGPDQRRQLQRIIDQRLKDGSDIIRAIGVERIEHGGRQIILGAIGDDPQPDERNVSLLGELRHGISLVVDQPASGLGIERGALISVVGGIELPLRPAMRFVIMRGVKQAQPPSSIANKRAIGRVHRVVDVSPPDRVTHQLAAETERNDAGAVLRDSRFQGRHGVFAGQD